MANSIRRNQICGLFRWCLFLGILVICQNAYGQSSITGIVFDKQKNPLNDIQVELLNDYYQSIRRTKTDSSGRYQFDGLVNGRYSVRVYAFRYDLEDQTQEQLIDTQNIRGGEGAGFFLLDFYLIPRKGGLRESEVGLVFAQEIPQDAKKLYEKALNDFSSKRSEEGIMNLFEAIKIFPDYFLALHRMGKELYMKELYDQAYPYLLKAVEINPKSPSTFYYLGMSLDKLGKDYKKAALASITQASKLASGSVQIWYALGRIEREQGMFEDAEKHLLQAKKLAGNGIAEIHKELAQLYSEDLKKYKEAADELELFLKASKMSDAESKKTKQIINGLRDKAKSQGSE